MKLNTPFMITSLLVPTVLTLSALPSYAGDRVVVRSRGPIASAILGPKTVVRSTGSSGYSAANVNLNVSNGVGYDRSANVNVDVFRSFNHGVNVNLNVSRGTSYGVARNNTFIQQDFHYALPQQTVFLQRDVYVPRQQTVFFNPGYNLGVQSAVRLRDVGASCYSSTVQQSMGSCYRGESLVEETVTRSPDGSETRTIRRLDR